MANPEKIGPDCVVQFTYTLKSSDGEVIDASEGDAALSYLHGHGNIVPGLEKALEGKVVGDEVKVTVPPEEGYGMHDPNEVKKFPREQFDFDPEEGMIVQAQAPDGTVVPLQVAKVEDDGITLDSNHPLAGQTLNFEVKVVEVREATDEEKTHGHAHDAGNGHHH